MGALKEGKPEVSPQMARSLESTGKVMTEMSREFGFLTLEEVAAITGISVEDALKARLEGRIFAVVFQGERIGYPSFQIDIEAGRIRPVIASLIKAAEDSGRSESGLALWMVIPTGYLDGERPVDCLDYPNAVLIAAQAAFNVQW